MTEQVQATAAQTVQALIREEAEACSVILELRERLDAAQERRKALRSAIEGARLGQALAGEVAKERLEAAQAEAAKNSPDNPVKKAYK